MDNRFDKERNCTLALGRWTAKGRESRYCLCSSNGRLFFMLSSVAKWGLTTSRFPTAASDTRVIFGDLNMEGYPCSTTCHGSQAGRGGSFFILSESALHQSLVHLVSKACKCTGVVDSYADNTTRIFEQARMCQHGCVKKVAQRLTATLLPRLSSEARSFWNDTQQ